MRIAICDDEVVLIEEVQHLLEAALGPEHTDPIVPFTTGEDLLAAWQEESFDLLFLDVQMGAGLDGMQVAQRLRQQDQEVMIVFLTSYGQYRDDAFDVKAAKYLDKPIDEAKLIQTLHRCRHDYQERNYELCLSLRPKKNANGIWDATPAQTIFLPVRQLLYIESCYPDLLVYTTDGHNYLTSGSISAMEEELEAHGCVRIHKSYLINLRYLRRIEPRQVSMAVVGQREQLLPLAREKRKLLEKQALHFKMGRR